MEKFSGHEHNEREEIAEIDRLLKVLIKKIELISNSLYELEGGITIEIGDNRVTIVEEIAQERTLVERLTDVGDYEVYIAGVNDILENDIQLIERIEAERGIEFGREALTAHVIQHFLEIIERLNL